LLAAGLCVRDTKSNENEAQAGLFCKFDSIRKERKKTSSMKNETCGGRPERILLPEPQTELTVGTNAGTNP